jgi:hypothetical protein
MKKFLVLIASVVFLNSCAPMVVVDSKPKQASAQKQAPPGQVKKTTGSKSAKAYAPGQQKKKN